VTVRSGSNPVVDGLRLRSSRVPALALERQHKLAEVVGQPDNGELRTRRHHPVIVATLSRLRPFSSRPPQTLYVLAQC
jgi:hypothetical protein